MVKALVSAAKTSVGDHAGHRTFLVSGSSFSMPDTAALQAHFGQPGNQAKGCGFPVAHILAPSPRRHRVAPGGFRGAVAVA